MDDDTGSPWETPELEPPELEPSELEPWLLPDDPETRLREFVDQRRAVLRRRDAPATAGTDEPEGS